MFLALSCGEKTSLQWRTRFAPLDIIMSYEMGLLGCFDQLSVLLDLQELVANRAVGCFDYSFVRCMRPLCRARRQPELPGGHALHVTRVFIGYQPRKRCAQKLNLSRVSWSNRLLLLSEGGYLSNVNNCA